MNTYITLFRGINVGGNNLLPMKELVALCESLGATKVNTYIQSGNLVYQHTEDLTVSLQAKVQAQFGFTPQILTLPLSTYRYLLEENPYQDEEPKHVHCFFCFPNVAKAELEKIATLKADSEHYLITEKAFYLLAPDGIGRSKLAAKVEKLLGVSTTARNLNSLNKILRLAESLES